MIEKLISDSIAYLCTYQGTDADMARWIRAIGFRLSSLKREFTDTATKTMAVDGVTLFVNNRYALTVPKLDVLFILIHEGLHVWFNHPVRLRDCMPHRRELVHKAADYAVNLTAQQAGCPFRVPDYALLDTRFVDDNGHCLNVERIVAMLAADIERQQQQQQQGQSDANTSNDSEQPAPASQAGDSGDDSGDDNANTATESDSGDTQASDDNSAGDSGDAAGQSGVNSQDAGGYDPNAGTPAETGDLLPAPSDADMQEMGRQAAAAAQLSKAGGDGVLPDAMLAAVNEALTDADVDWLAELRDRFATAVDQSDYSWERINAPVLIAAHQVEPSLYRESIGRIAIVGDESSSMSDEALNVIAKETAAIVSEWNPVETLIVRHTSKVVFTERLHQGQEPTPRKKRSHGGTAFNPVIDLCEAEDCEVIVWVSDMYPCGSVKETNIPVIWLGTESGSRSAWERYVGYGEYVQVADLAW